MAKWQVWFKVRGSKFEKVMAIVTAMGVDDIGMKMIGQDEVREQAKSIMGKDAVWGTRNIRTRGGQGRLQKGVTEAALLDALRKGPLLWVDARSVLRGIGARTNPNDVLRRLLKQKKITKKGKMYYKMGK